MNFLPVSTIHRNRTTPYLGVQSYRRGPVSVAVYFVLVVLLDAQVTFCDGERGMIENDHDHNRITALLPCVVAKGLAQRMAADVSLDANRSRGCGDHAVRL